MTLAEIAERYMLIGEVATMFGITRQTVRRIVKAGELHPRLIGTTYFFDRDEVEDFRPRYHPVPYWRRRGRLL